MPIGVLSSYTTDYEKITLTLQPSNSSTCKCTQDDDSQTT